MMPKLPDIHLPTSLKDRLAQGHPWVYRNNLPESLHYHPDHVGRLLRRVDWSD